LENNLSNLSNPEMLLPGVTGARSVKEIMAHLTAWEQLFIEWYFAGKQGKSPETPAVGMSKKMIDAINQQIFENNESKTLDEIVETFHSSFRQIIAIIESIPQEEMFSHNTYSWTGKWTLADYIAGNTRNHYAWAKYQIKNWIDRRTDGL